MKEAALNEINPHLFTLATLTGHAVLTSGVGYSVSKDKLCSSKYVYNFMFIYKQIRMGLCQNNKYL